MSIQVGDLVMMVHAPCECCTEPMGIPFTVTAIAKHGVTIRCNRTAREVGIGPVAGGYSTWGIPLSLLIKIDPPPLTEDTPTGEELTA